MKNINVRVAKLQNNNANDMAKYFSITFPDGLKAGQTINIKVTADDDEIANMISDDGYLKNNHLFRRWVMAQMFKLRKGNFDKNLAKLGYSYQFKVVSEELHALAAMQRDDDPEFYKRSQFWNKRIAVSMIDRFYDDAMKYIRFNSNYKNGERTTKFIGIVKSGYAWSSIFTEDKCRVIQDINNTDLYKVIEKRFDDFMKKYSFILKTLKKENYNQFSFWKSTFKGAGAYYTLQNMFRYHNVFLKSDDKFFKKTCMGELAVKEMDSKLGEWEVWQLYPLMERVIEDNNFSFPRK